MNSEKRNKLNTILMWLFSVSSFILITLGVLKFRAYIFNLIFVNWNILVDINTKSSLLYLLMGIISLIIAKLFSNMNNKKDDEMTSE